MRTLIIGLLTASALAAQAPSKSPPKLAPCDTSAVLAKATPIFDVGTITLAKSCPAFAQAVRTWYAATPAAHQWSAGQVIAALIAEPFALPPVDSTPSTPPPRDTTPAPPTPIGASEPVFDATRHRMVWTDSMNSYRDLATMGKFPVDAGPRLVPEESPAWNAKPVDPSRYAIIPGRTGSALRMNYSGQNQDGAGWLSMNTPVTAKNTTQYLTYWARVTFSQPLRSQLAVKWFMLWHWESANTRTQFNTHDHLPCPSSKHGTYWQVWDQAETSCQGNQPIGPYFEQIADGQWHRFTHEFRPNTTKGARDGVARMWIDGVKVVDVSASAVGVTPPGGEKPWCSWDDVDNLVANDRIAFLWWGGVQTSYVTAPWTYDLDDFSWWTAK